MQKEEEEEKKAKPPEMERNPNKILKKKWLNYELPWAGFENAEVFYTLYKSTLYDINRLSLASLITAKIKTKNI